MKDLIDIFSKFNKNLNFSNFSNFSKINFVKKTEIQINFSPNLFLFILIEAGKMI